MGDEHSGISLASVSRAAAGEWLVAALLCLSLLIAHPAVAKDKPQQKLKEVEKALEGTRQRQADFQHRSELLEAEIQKLRLESVAAAKSAQEHEQAITGLEAQLADLAAGERAKTASLQRRQKQQSQLLMALQRLARNPPEALAFAPGQPIDAVRAAILLAAALPQVERQAQALKRELAELAGLRERIAGKKAELTAQRTALEAEQARIADLIGRKAELQARVARSADENARRLLALAAQASDLRDLIQRLESERQRREAEEQRRRQAELLARAMTRPPRIPDEKDATSRAEPSRPKGIRAFAAAHGALVVPVSGHILLRFGDPDEFGSASKGLVFEALPGAQVVTPWDGQIEFAGPFRGYGQILIIAHDGGYHSLLAGLGQIDGTVGQWLVAGEPVGTLPSDGPKATLYLELRRHGQPINPLPWLATHGEKVSG